ncbi:hypothetical protein ZWY2020_026094 [Hordeum vulgare]|nr:hypothetical protein ZWY2020_026094 [Hordeum vulgare]
MSMEDIPTELVVEILLRLPWTSRRRVRLVCRSWRDLVQQGTKEMQQCRDAVPLVVTTESAYVLGGDDHGPNPETSIPRPRELWSLDRPAHGCVQGHGAASLLADDIPFDDSAPRRPSTFLNVVVLGNVESFGRSSPAPQSRRLVLEDLGSLEDEDEDEDEDSELEDDFVIIENQPEEEDQMDLEDDFVILANQPDEQMDIVE